MRVTLLTALSSAALSTAVSAPVHAQMGEALDGVDTVYVVVEIAGPDSARLGLSDRALQDTVEHGLRRFGIAISEDVHAHLKVELTLLESQISGDGSADWMWVLTLGFHEPVVPRRHVEDFADQATQLAMGEESARDGVRFLALTGTYGTTWSETEAGVERPGRVGAVVTESLGRLLARFLTQFLDEAGAVWTVEVHNVAPYAIDVVVGEVTMEVWGESTLRLPVTSDERPEVRIRCTDPEQCPDWLSWIRQIEVSVSRVSLP